MKKFALFLMILSCLTAKSQPIKKLSTIEALANEIDKFLTEDKDLPDTACLQRFIVAKFSWNGKAVPTQVDFNPNTPQPYATAMTKAIQAAFRYSTITKDLKRRIVNRQIIYPLVVTNYSPCDYEYTWIDSKADSIVHSAKARWQRMNAPQFDESVTNLLHFGAKEYSSLDCIILYPSVKGNMQ